MVIKSKDYFLSKNRGMLNQHGSYFNHSSRIKGHFKLLFSTFFDLTRNLIDSFLKGSSYFGSLLSI